MTRVQAHRRPSLEERIEDFEYLLDTGEWPPRAAVRAGWPTIGAAALALRRAHHPRFTEINAFIAHEKRADVFTDHRAVTCRNISR